MSVTLSPMPNIQSIKTQTIVDVIDVISEYLYNVSDERVENLLYNCREQLKIYQSYNYDDQYNESIITIFNMCHDMKIAYLLPPLFYSCLCEAYDNYTLNKYQMASLHGFTILV